MCVPPNIKPQTTPPRHPTHSTLAQPTRGPRTLTPRPSFSPRRCTFHCPSPWLRECRRRMHPALCSCLAESSSRYRQLGSVLTRRKRGREGEREEEIGRFIIPRRACTVRVTVVVLCVCVCVCVYVCVHSYLPHHTLESHNRDTNGFTVIQRSF